MPEPAYHRIVAETGEILNPKPKHRTIVRRPDGTYAYAGRRSTTTPAQEPTNG